MSTEPETLHHACHLSSMSALDRSPRPQAIRHPGAVGVPVLRQVCSPSRCSGGAAQGWRAHATMGTAHSVGAGPRHNRLSARILALALLFGLSPAARADTPTATSAPDESQLIEHGHYVNKSGVEVHSPAHTKSGKAPAGATARCRDGSYSFSQHHSGTCSHHGGVAGWLGG